MKKLEENKEFIFMLSTLVMVILLISAVICFNKSTQANTGEKVSYTDSKNIDYNVNLKENEYFTEQTVEKEKQYIGELINTIDSNFKYNLEIENGEEYTYSYKIVADVNVVEDKTKKSLYSFSDDLLSEKTGNATGTLDINENVSIDYNKYNDKIEDFVNTYELSNVTSTVNLNLCLSINGVNKEFSVQDIQIMGLEIPLTTNTISISTNYNKLSSESYFKIASNIDGKAFLNASIILAVIDVILFIATKIFLKQTSTDVEKYKKELKTIVNNYEPYISKVKDNFNMEGYQILNVNNFADLLEIRDTMRIPIIMIENKRHLVTCFIIPTPNKILYSYTLSTGKYTLNSGRHSDFQKEKVEEKYEQKV